MSHSNLVTYLVYKSVVYTIKPYPENWLKLPPSSGVSNNTPLHLLVDLSAKISWVPLLKYVTSTTSKGIAHKLKLKVIPYI